MRRTIHGCGSSTGSGVRSMRYAWALSNCAAPSYGLVSTAKRSAGRRRHHSHSSDWIPPIFGGKSFVTKRCFTSRPASAATSSPRRALAQRACSARTGSSPRRYRARRGGDALVAPVGGVAEHDEGVAAEPARVAPGDVPPPVAVEQRPIVGVQQIEHVDPGDGVGVERALVSAAEPDRRRAGLLAVVAPVDAVADGRSQLRRDRRRVAGGPTRGSGWRRSHRAPRWRRSGRRRGSDGRSRSRRPPARRSG